MVGVGAKAGSLESYDRAVPPLRVGGGAVLLPARQAVSLAYRLGLHPFPSLPQRRCHYPAAPPMGWGWNTKRGCEPCIESQQARRR